MDWLHLAQQVQRFNAAAGKYQAIVLCCKQRVHDVALKFIVIYYQNHWPNGVRHGTQCTRRFKVRFTPFLGSWTHC
jgi:hypothetical protein